MADVLRKIIHVDMDAFYAAVEQRDNPGLRGRPVVVGGSPHSRGVVATCSYEARRYGIHSAMPAAHAYRLCPEAVFIRPRMAVYRMISAQIRTIFSLYTDLIEPLSLDEAYLDVTDNRLQLSSATLIAEDILRRIKRETGLTASAGVSYNKFLAKVASDINKPDGLTVIPPEQAEQFIAQLPIEKFYGIGRVTAQKMRTMKIFNGADLRQLDLPTLRSIFGKQGRFFFDIARGIDRRPVEPRRQRKSAGREITLSQDTRDMATIAAIIERLSLQVESILRRHKVAGKTVTLKIRYADFTTLTRSRTVMPCCDRHGIAAIALELLKKTEAGRRPVRLVGVTVSNFVRQYEPACRLFQPEFSFDV